MKNFISKDVIIYIGLVYKYITKKEKAISKYEALMFAKEVNKNLKMIDNCTCEISFEEEEISPVLHLMIYDRMKEEYIMEEYSLLDMWYDYQPYEIRHATLMENALSKLNINREELEIEQKYKKTYGTKGIYSLSQKSAVESTKQILMQEGNKNIKICSASLTTFEGSTVGYNVSYECDRLYESADLLIMKKTSKLRDSLFEKYFEVEEGVLISDLVKATNYITETWNSLHKLLEKNIEDYDSWSRLETIRQIKYENKEYLIIKIMIHKYIVIDLYTKKTLSNEEVFNKLNEQFFIENFNERPLGEKMYHRIYWFIKGNNVDEIINYYNENKKILNYPTRIFYKINMDYVYTFLSIILNDGIQLSFQGKNQILYETLFINSDLTPSKMQDTKDRISIEKMREMFDRVPYIRIPKEYIPDVFFEDEIIKEKVKAIKI